MSRPIKQGSWVHVRIPGRRLFTTEVLLARPDGTFDLKDTNGRLRTVKAEVLSPANKPKSAR